MKSKTAAILVTGMFMCVAIMCATFVYYVDPAGSLPVVTIILATIVPSAGVIANLAKTEEVNTKMDKVLNGTMDRKIVENVHEAMDQRENGERK